MSAESESTHPPLGCIPYLCEPQSQGIAQLSKRAPMSLPSGADSDRRVVDVVLAHNVVLDSELEAVESFLPGFTAERARAFGAGSDGRRVRKWVPDKSGKRICLTPPGSDLPLYEGPCDLKHASATITGTTCVLTLNLRLHSVEVNALGPMGLLLGEEIAYKLVSEGMSGPLSTAPLPGGLPFGAATVSEPEEEAETEAEEQGEGKARPGDVVVFFDGEDEQVGIVRTVAWDRLSVALDLGGEQLQSVDLGAVAVIHKICGPRGGPAAGLSKLPSSTPVRIVLDALISAHESGDIELRPEGYPLTKTIVSDIEERLALEADLPEEP